MTLRERYCPSCQESFPTAEAGGQCPHCAGRQGPLGTPTVDFAETIALELPAIRSASDDLGRDLVAELVGSQLDCYTIERYLGKGGMAWVFLAKHQNLRRPCAIKVLCPELQGRKRDSLELFVDEARVAASVVHPHLVMVHNIGESSGYPYIEMEYVDGHSLQTLAERQWPTIIQAADYLRQACLAMAEAHRHGLVHRDFKPANIMVRSDGFAKLADFGLAKRILDTSEEEGLSGTPYFMAPELFAGQRASKASDVYAVGVSLFYLLARGYPYDHQRWTELARLHAEAPTPDVRAVNPEVSDEIAALVTACLAKSPADRPDDGAACAAALLSALRGLRDLPGLVAEALQGCDVDCEYGECRVQVHVHLGNGRGQRVVIEEAVRELDRTRLVRISSVCAPVNTDYLRRALELNLQIPHGALAIQEVDGQPHFVMINCYPRATCDAVEIRHSVQDIAYWADQVEWILTGDDVR